MVGLCLPDVLCCRAYVTKVLGILAMLCSGMSVGKEGPFVHIAACIASLLPYYANNEHMRH